jgi:hypothetical protein
MFVGGAAPHTPRRPVAGYIRQKSLFHDFNISKLATLANTGNTGQPSHPTKGPNHPNPDSTVVWRQRAISHDSSTTLATLDFIKKISVSMTNNFGGATKAPSVYSQGSGTITAYTVYGQLPQDLVGLSSEKLSGLFDPGFLFDTKNQPNRYASSLY